MQVHAGRVGVLETKPYGGVCRVESVLLNGLRSVVELPPSSVLNEVYEQVGGRLIFLSQVAESSDMLATCKSIYEREKACLLQQTWILGKDLDEHVEEEQTYCVRSIKECTK